MQADPRIVNRELGRTDPAGNTPCSHVEVVAGQRALAPIIHAPAGLACAPGARGTVATNSYAFSMKRCNEI